MEHLRSPPHNTQELGGSGKEGAHTEGTSENVEVNKTLYSQTISTDVLSDIWVIP